MRMNRRRFLRDAAVLTAGMGLAPAWVPRVAEALERAGRERLAVLWIQGQSCSGCSVSLLNTERPGPAELLTRYVSLWFHPTLSAATGERARQVVDRAVEAGGYVLAVEGSVPVGMPLACTVGDDTFDRVLVRTARRARAVLSVGTCASFGGIPAARSNPTGARAVADVLADAGVRRPLVRIPGCPAHPYWVVGSVLYVAAGLSPALDEKGRPAVFFGRLVHDRCPRFPDYEREHFARFPGDEGCLFRVGCQGVVTHADCPWRGWNGGTNWCVRAGAPCVGCARPLFARDPEYPFFRLHEDRIQTG